MSLSDRRARACQSGRALYTGALPPAPGREEPLAIRREEVCTWAATGAARRWESMIVAHEVGSMRHAGRASGARVRVRSAWGPRHGAGGLHPPRRARPVRRAGPSPPRSLSRPARRSAGPRVVGRRRRSGERCAMEMDAPLAQQRKKRGNLDSTRESRLSWFQARPDRSFSLHATSTTRVTGARRSRSRLGSRLYLYYYRNIQSYRFSTARRARGRGVKNRTKTAKDAAKKSFHIRVSLLSG